MSKLWGGRFQDAISSVALHLSESISLDRRLWAWDIRGSKAHAEMLAECGILSRDSYLKISSGLDQIAAEISSGRMEWDESLEDIHTHIEKRLTELAGDDGKRLHTGRSRNDQVATATRLFLKDQINSQLAMLRIFQQELLNRAQAHTNDIWAGYTHTQIAQPVLLSHYLMSWFWGFTRDYELLSFALRETDESPLGAAALAGTNYPVNRELTAALLGFSRVSENSLDTVANRDYQLAYHFFAARFFSRLSRFCEDLVLFSTAEFGYVKMKDSITTGSSIMPQKKNPDIAELLRGKSGRITGNLMALLQNLKGLPMTYNRDLQEDKVYLFDTVDQVDLGIAGITEVLKNTEFLPGKVSNALERGFAAATDVADYMVQNLDIPFREAHEFSGRMVSYLEGANLTYKDVDEAMMDKVWGFRIPESVFRIQDSPARKQGTGSTSPESVSFQIASGRKWLELRSSGA